MPWTLIRDVTPDGRPELFQDESFVCVCAETTMDASSEEEFLALRHELIDWQARLYAEGGRKLLVVFQTVDTGGKDRHVIVFERPPKQSRAAHCAETTFSPAR